MRQITFISMLELALNHLLHQSTQYTLWSVQTLVGDITRGGLELGAEPSIL